MSKNRQNIKKSKSQISLRLYLLLYITIALLIIVGIVRVGFIKFVYGEKYEAAAISNQVNKIQDKIINPNRGGILDRNNQALAISFTVYDIILDVRVLVQQTPEIQEETLNGLNEILDIPMETLKDYIKIDPSTNKPVNDKNWFVIQKGVSFQKGQELIDRNLKCVYTEEDTKRTYPHDSLASQVIGFIRGDTMYGLESQYNDLMVGVPGRTFRTFESDKSVVTRQERPKDGYTIVTTIDLTIQQYAEEAAKKAYLEYQPKNSSVIVMSPKTGEILAMADYPNFNLNNPTEISFLKDIPNYQATWDSYTDEQKMDILNKAWKNFNITDTFEPGSIFKPLVVAAAIEEGVISKNETFYCGGSKTYDDYHIGCHKKSGHGTVTIEQVLANSCNVGMMDIMSKLGRDKFYKYQHDFGFGEKTGIDLPNETSAASLMYSLEQLNIVELATCSFGQGFNSTALQSLSGMAAVINGGDLIKPYIVSQIIDEDGNIVKENSPEVVRKVISEDTSDYLRKALESVVKESGTGKKAVIDGYSIGGKTGTAEQGVRKVSDDKKLYTCSFIAYFPVEDPEYIAISVLHHPNPKTYVDGVTSPVPMLREVIENIIKYKSIPPSYTVENKEKSVDIATEVKLNDYTGKSLQQTIKELNELGIDYELAGSGGDTVLKQYPNGNTTIKKGTKILLYISVSDKNKELVEIPNVLNMTVPQAQEMLKAAGFEYTIEISEDTSESTENSTTENTAEQKVYEQMPGSEFKVEKGTNIKLKVK